MPLKKKGITHDVLAKCVSLVNMLWDLFHMGETQLTSTESYFNIEDMVIYIEIHMIFLYST